VSFYIFCGADGLGKTTIAKLLAQKLEKPYFKFPYGSDNDTEEIIYSGQRIRQILNKDHTCDPVAFQALQLINKLEAVPVLKALELKHGIVLVDRWSLSALIYGEVDGVDRVWNNKICKFFDSQIQPAIMFIFTGTPFKNDGDKYGKKQQAIAALYDNYCKEHADNKLIVKIDVTGKSIETVAFEVLSHIVRDAMKIKPLITSTTSTVVHAKEGQQFSLTDTQKDKNPDKSSHCYDSMVI
jgi:thymidylate kinase